MHAHALVLLALAAGPNPAELPREPGIYWEETVEMQMGGMSMPPHTMKVCKGTKQEWEEPPAQQGSEGCKLTDLKRSGKRMTWKTACDNGMAGEGEMTWGRDVFAGSMRMTTPMGEMRSTFKGRKLGGDCDANEARRTAARMQEQGEALQQQVARQTSKACDDAVASMDPMTISMMPQCKDRAAAFCARLRTRDGFSALARKGSTERDEAKKLCGEDLAAIEARLCSEAAKDYERGGAPAKGALDFVEAGCPGEARAIAQRECAGRSYTELDPSKRQLCTTYAREELEAASKARRKGAEGEKTPAAVEEGKKILRGIFGR